MLSKSWHSNRRVLETRFRISFHLGFPCGSACKESARNEGDLGSIPGLVRSPGEGKGYPLQYSGLENPMDCIVHGVTKSQTQLSDFHFHFPSELEWWLIHGDGREETSRISSCESESHSVMSDSLPSHGLYSPWNSPGQNTGVGSLSLLQGIFPTQGTYKLRKAICNASSSCQ